MLVELLCLIVFSVRLVHYGRVIPREKFWKDPKNICIIVIIVVGGAYHGGWAVLVGETLLLAGIVKREAKGSFGRGESTCSDFSCEVAADILVQGAAEGAVQKPLGDQVIERKQANDFSQCRRAILAPFPIFSRQIGRRTDSFLPRLADAVISRFVLLRMC